MDESDSLGLAFLAIEDGWPYHFIMIHHSLVFSFSFVNLIIIIGIGPMAEQPFRCRVSR